MQKLNIGNANLEMLGKPVAVLAALVLLMAAVSACGSSDESGETTFSVTNAVVPVAAGANTALYFELTNTGSKTDSLIEARTDVANEVEIHQSSQDSSGMMKMQEQDEVKVNPGETVDFEPGGYHIMLLEADELTEGDTVEVELLFKSSPALTVEATVVTYADVAH